MIFSGLMWHRLQGKAPKRIWLSSAIITGIGVPEHDENMQCQWIVLVVTLDLSSQIKDPLYH